MNHKFKLHTKYTPSPAQKAAIKNITENYGKTSKQTLLGITGSGKTFTFANVIEKIQKPTHHAHPPPSSLASEREKRKDALYILINKQCHY